MIMFCLEIIVMILTSIIIPFSEDRHDNLYQMLRFLHHDKWLMINSELILVCQNGYIEIDGANIINCRMDYYCRSKMINTGVAASKGKILILLDSDRILPNGYFEKVCKKLKEYQCITTKNLWQLIESVSDQQIIQNNYKAIEDPRSVSNSMHRKGTFSGNTILYKDCFVDCGGMDESFVGYGYNDIDFARSAIKKGKEMVFVTDKELHLYHEKKGTQRERWASNVLNGIKYCKKWKLTPEPLLVEYGKLVGIDVLSQFKRKELL